MKSPNFSVFILTHGRPGKVYTYQTLRKSGYTGPIYLIVDDLDESLPEYIKKYDQEVLVFSKKDAALSFDIGDNFENMRGVVYARNACFNLAKKLGISYFIQLDDDYTSFQYRFNSLLQYQPKVLKNLDTVFDALVKFYIKSGATSLAMAQGGDFIGGDQSSFSKSVKIKHKCMNSFICSPERPFRFCGRLNEDVNAYTSLASIGNLFFTANQVNLNQVQTQASSGGMKELYLDQGTYIKSFYSVIYHPSSVKIGYLRGQKGSRLHHSISWKNTTPMILRESIKRK